MRVTYRPLTSMPLTSMSLTSSETTHRPLPSASSKPRRLLLVVAVAAATLAGCQTSSYSPSAERELNRIANQR